MNMLLKMVASLALVVMLPAGLAMAGRGGGGGHAGGGNRGGGGFHAAGGAARPASFHTPSFSSPRQSFSAPHQSFSAPRQSFNAPREGFSGANRSANGERGGIAGTPNWDNRLNGGNRTNFDNRLNTANRSNFENRANFGNNFATNNGMNNLVRPTHGDWNRGDWYHGDWHGNWNNSWYNRPMGWWTAGDWAGDYVSAIPWSWGYWPYSNPYYAGPIVDGGATIDYSLPIVEAQAAALPVAQAGLTAEQQATPLFDAARNAFMQGDYKTALAQVDQAIAQVPNDTVLHEFRGLVLFALGRYKEAAAADYAVLSAGPGWDWTTMSALYPNAEVYTQQLRALEQYAKSHPAASDARFLLADHYLTCGYTDAAAVQLKHVVQMDPKDQLSAQLLNSISASNAAQQAVLSQPVIATKPVDASSLAGNWTATRADSATIKLALAADGKFTWALDQKGKPQQFSGTYSVADNLLVLKQGSNAVMVGQVAAIASNRFNFKLAGDNPGDPGLTFMR